MQNLDDSNKHMHISAPMLELLASEEKAGEPGGLDSNNSSDKFKKSVSRSGDSSSEGDKSSYGDSSSKQQKIKIVQAVQDLQDG